MNEIFKTTRLRFNEMYEDAIKFIEKTYGSVGNYFTNASPFGQILRVIINLGRLIFYYIEDSITELNINTAARAESIRGLASLVGHNSTRAISATGVLKLTYNGKPIDIYGNTIIIPNYTTLLNNMNGLRYTIFLNNDSISMELTDRNSIDIVVKQGIIEVQKFTSNGEKLQSFNASVRGGKNIDNFEVNIYVNNEKWKIYESLYDIPKDGKGCLVRTSVNTGIDIFFGNGYFGKIPSKGAEIRVEYLLNQGSEGNINTTDTKIKWTFLDNGYDITGKEIDLNQILNVSIEKEITFGTNAEPLYLTRLIAPKTSRNFVLARPEDYIIFLEKFNYFGIIDAYTTFDDNNFKDDNVIYLFLIPDVNKRISGNDNYFTIPEELFILTSSEKERIYELIDKSNQKLINTVVKIVDPIIKKYVLNIALIIFEGYSRDFIKQQIIDKLSQYFVTFRRRDRIPKSDLIRIIENIEGIDSVNLWFASQENEMLKKTNPESEDIGIDEFGDIIIKQGELPIIRGGWEDRNGIFYEDSTNEQKPSSVNIAIKKVIPKTYNSETHRMNIEKI